MSTDSPHDVAARKTAGKRLDHHHSYVPPADPTVEGCAVCGASPSATNALKHDPEDAHQADLWLRDEHPDHADPRAASLSGGDQAEVIALITEMRDLGDQARDAIRGDRPDLELHDELWARHHELADRALEVLPAPTAPADAPAPRRATQI